MEEIKVMNAFELVETLGYEEQLKPEPPEEDITFKRFKESLQPDHSFTYGFRSILADFGISKKPKQNKYKILVSDVNTEFKPERVEACIWVKDPVDLKFRRESIDYTVDQASDILDPKFQELKIRIREDRSDHNHGRLIEEYLFRRD